ncbi:hypothetical protein B0J17DRAFT_713461 [Rhizoctonia solani]|nr:hypothetical protein B0J17DRAFT_713461 [Rhizoctonia solani]
MGSLSGTKAPVKRPLPPGVETPESMEARLIDFWGSVIIPMLSPSATTLDNDTPNTKLDTELSAESITHRTDSGEAHTPSVLLVSHGATISKLINQVLLRKYGYEAACERRHGIYNTSISILRMGVRAIVPKPLSSDENDVEESGQTTASVSGVLIAFGSITHLIRKNDIVVENADLL